MLALKNTKSKRRTKHVFRIFWTA